MHWNYYEGSGACLDVASACARYGPDGVPLFLLWTQKPLFPNYLSDSDQIMYADNEAYSCCAPCLDPPLPKWLETIDSRIRHFSGLLDKTHEAVVLVHNVHHLVFPKVRNRRWPSVPHGTNQVISFLRWPIKTRWDVHPFVRTYVRPSVRSQWNSMEPHAQ